MLADTNVIHEMYSAQCGRAFSGEPTGSGAESGLFLTYFEQKP